MRAPSLAGLYGREVKLADGRNLTADETYLRDKILNPNRQKLAADYKQVMPAFRNVIPNDDLDRLLAYLKSSGATAQQEATPEVRFNDERHHHRRAGPARPPHPGFPASATGRYLHAEHTLRSWFFTTDHKRIALLYLASITAFFVIGAVTAGLVRLALVVPDGQVFTNDTYNKLFTIHGVVMVWFFLIPSIPATFGNFLIPLMIGARDLAFPKLNLASWYVFMTGALFTLASVVLGGSIPAGPSTPALPPPSRTPGWCRR